MKRIFVLLTSLMLCFLAASCGETDIKDSRDTGSILSNNNSNYHTAEDEEYIYFLDVLAVRKISKADNSVEDLYVFGDGEIGFTVAMECFEERIYMLNLASELISMDKDGKNVKKSVVEIDAIKDLNQNSSISPYVYDGNLYFLSNNSGNIYCVDAESHSLELVEGAKSNQFIASDNTVFIKKTENDMGRLYVKYEGEEETLFSAEEESVLLNRVNYAEDYVYYISSEDHDFSSVSLWRVDLDGKNKVLIKSFDMLNQYADVKYDNRYIYLCIGNENFVKIDKETFEETDISSMLEWEKRSAYEVVDEKLFHFAQSYFIDSKSGEKIEF